MLPYSLLYPQTNTARRAVKLDGMWKFSLDPQTQGEREGWPQGLPTQERIPVPASFQDFFTDKDTREYAGDFWYETKFFLPREWAGKRLFLRFGSVTHRAVVYCNGVEVARHQGGFLPFCADITAAARLDQENTLVVKANNELTETNIPCGRTITLKNGKKMAKPYFDFFNYAGIHRSVHLLALPQASIQDVSLTFALEERAAQVRYTVDCAPGCTVALSLLDAQGNLAASGEGTEGVLTVKEPRLWGVRDPYLYRLVVTLFQGDQLADQYTLETGIRTVEVRGAQILLNGKPVYLKGFGKHEDSDLFGRGFNPAALKRDFELMKWMGANSFRTSHYPYAEEVYQMADREGFLIIDEVPAVGMFESLMNFFDATTGKQSGFFGKETTPQLLQAHLQAVEEMIARDKNHPCVMAWSLFNEPETTNENAVPYFEQVFARARELDPQQRPRTFALIGNSTPETCKCVQLSDFVCLNRYYGWYNQGGYEISDAEENFRKEMDGWKARGLHRPFVFTEYGGDTLSSEHKLPSVMWSQEYQREALEMLHRVFDSYDFVQGEQVWNFADFQTGEGIMRVNGNKKGVFTRQRQPKDAAFLLKARWESIPHTGWEKSPRAQQGE